MPRLFRGGRSLAALLMLFLGTRKAMADELPMDRQASEPANFRLLDQQSAWARLPKAIEGQGAELPAWALILADALPSTTAAMLEMDHVQRHGSPLDPRLRAKLRWVTARANGCAYSQAYARADLHRAGGKSEELAAIEDHPPSLSPQERRAYDFAARLCTEAYGISDDDVRQLLEDRGPEELTAMVLLVAYANFQDRLFQGLGVAVEPDGPLPPAPVRFSWEAKREMSPTSRPRVTPEPPKDAANVPTLVDDLHWKALPLSELRGRLDRQKLRAPRIPVPAAEVVEKNIPPGLYPPGQSSTIVWNSMTFGYQPRLAAAWIFTLRRFREEAGLADDFRQSVFWVVTRANQCFY